MNSQLFIKINELLSSNLPFFMIRKKGEETVRLIHQNDERLHLQQHDKMTCVSFSKFLNIKDQYFIHGEVNFKFNYEISIGNDSLEGTQDIIPEDGSRESYIKMVNDAVGFIKTGSLRKVVLSRKQPIKGHFNNEKIISNLLDLYPDANCYFFYHPKIGKWCGATPEILLSIKGKMLHTMSLAGTRKLGGEKANEWGRKELEEQRFVTDSIVDDLRRVGVEQLEIGELQTIKAGNLLHLHSAITAKMPDSKTALDYLHKLHPTPAVCGLPKALALKYILDNEGYDRSFYTGYLGLITAQEQEYFVNLRCMELTENGATLYAGGGITAKSDAVAEYEETVNKMKTMYRLL